MVDHAPGAYLDHASASPLDPRVRAAMTAALDPLLGNPEGLHDRARPAAELVEASRSDVAALLGVATDGLIFTAGDVEARNLAVKGIWSATRHLGAHIVTTAVEHDAVTHSCRALTRDGATFTAVAVDGEGRPAPQDVADAIGDDTVLVSISHAQAEIGTVQDVAAICAAIRDRRADVTIHVDASTTAGLVPLDIAAWDCDAVSVGGAAMGGPRWAGALWVRTGTRLHPLIDGGAQEGGKRSGHHDLAGIAGMGAAARIAAAEGAERAAAMTARAAQLTDGLLAIDGVRLHGPATGRLPGHVQIGADGVEGETLTLLLAAAGVACAPGSACTSVGKSSAVLEAIGLRPPESLSAVLFTLSQTTSADEIAFAVDAAATAIGRIRGMGVRG